MLESSWDHLGFMLASCWYQRISPKCCGADFGSRIKISGNLLGQSDQNFDIYPFDWSQVASWGLAAEGEALTIDIEFDWISMIWINFTELHWISLSFIGISCILIHFLWKTKGASRGRCKKLVVFKSGFQKCFKDRLLFYEKWRADRADVAKTVGF